MKISPGLPPEKWSSLMYGFEPDGGLENAKEETHAEEIVAKLRQVDVLTSQGRPVAEVVRSIGVTEVTYYRWDEAALTADIIALPTQWGRYGYRRIAALLGVTP